MNRMTPNPPNNESPSACRIRIFLRSFRHLRRGGFRLRFARRGIFTRAVSGGFRIRAHPSLIRRVMEMGSRFGRLLDTVNGGVLLIFGDVHVHRTGASRNRPYGVRHLLNRDIRLGISKSAQEFPLRRGESGFRRKGRIE